MHIMNRQPSFVKEIAHALRQRCHLARDCRLLVAVSGGADSVALLRAMTSLMDKRGWSIRLAVGHVNHQLRTVSHEETRFVQTLASDLGLPFFEATLTPPRLESRQTTTDNQPAENIEKWARQARYAALQAMAMTFDASGVVAAHHADDQLETMLMRLMRGSSVQGLAGMKWRRKLAAGSELQLLRPMLGTTHEQAVDYLNSLDQTWCEDHTNTDTTRLRAALRAKVLPELKALSPKLASRVMHASEQLHGAGQMLAAAVKQAIHEHVTQAVDGLCVDRPGARAMTPAVLQGMLRELLMGAGVASDSLRREVVMKLAAAMQDNDGSTRRFVFSNGVVATMNRTSLMIVRSTL